MPLAEMIRDVRQRQIVRRHQTNGAALDQTAYHCFGADTAIMRIGAREDFIEEE